MPPATKRRKVSATVKTPLTVPASQKGIHAFGKISKSQTQSASKSILAKFDFSQHINGKSELSTEGGRKRKLDFIESNPERVQRPEDDIKATRLVTSDTSSQLRSSYVAQPTTPRKRVHFESGTTETPTKGARSRFESLTLPSSSPPTNSSTSSQAQHDTPPSSPASISSSNPTCEQTSGLPDELQDLINLHSSFLTALSLHYAHNGSMTPADLRNLGPGVERAWRKRRVTTEDVRRILALEGGDGSENACPLYLSDYGSGKIYVEVSDSSYSQKAQRRPINEEALNSIFLRNLNQQWTLYKATQRPPSSPATFVASLPLLPITLCSSLSKLAPLLSKGQRRLEDLKSGAIRAQQKPLGITSANTVSSPREKAKQTSARSMDLFSRIKAKQLHQSTLPLPPSAEVLTRKSALHRLSEIALVLESLAVSSKKHANDDAVAEVFKSKIAHVSFTMPTLVQHLQTSLRNPIGKEEALRCIRLLAEVVPEWVGIREVGRMVGVTVRGDGVDKRKMGQRIEEMVKKL